MLTRERERQLEVLVELGGWALDFEELAYRSAVARRAAKREQYRDMRLFDPAAHRALLAEHKAARQALRARTPGYKARLSDRDAREVREMYRLEVPVKKLAQAFSINVATVQAILRGESHAKAGGPVHDAAPRRPGERVRVVRGAAHPFAKLTPELVAQVLAMGGSLRAIGRAVGVSHDLVARIKAGDTWLQRAEAAE